MITASSFINECVKQGYQHFTGTPCSYLKPFINYVIDDPSVEFLEASNEGDAVALASGLWLAGNKSVVMFQNSGLGNAVNPITSLSQTMGIPFLGIVTHRGEPNGPSDEPQHELMGEITEELLTLMKIPFAEFPTEVDQVEEALNAATVMIEKERRPFFFIMKKGSVEDYEGNFALPNDTFKNYPIDEYLDESSFEENTRTKVLDLIRSRTNQSSPLVITTGKSGRELFELDDNKRNFYMVGSMGCALSIGFGISHVKRDENVIVIDGDGAFLMRLGSMSYRNQVHCSNLVHIVLDNGCHDSTGGQRSFSEMVDFCGVAKSFGFRKIFDIHSLSTLENALSGLKPSEGPYFLRVKILPGSPKTLGRPTVKPCDVSHRLREFLKES